MKVPILNFFAAILLRTLIAIAIALYLYTDKPEKESESFHQEFSIKIDPKLFAPPLKPSRFDKAIKNSPNNFENYVSRGTERASEGNYQEALNDFNKAIELNPKIDNFAYLNRASAKSDLGDSQGAIDDYTQIIKFNPVPKYIDMAYYGLGCVEFDQANYQQAIKNFDKAIGINPNFYGSYYNRGGAKKLIGDKQGAEKDFKKAAELPH